MNQLGRRTAQVFSWLQVSKLVSFLLLCVATTQALASHTVRSAGTGMRQRDDSYEYGYDSNNNINNHSPLHVGKRVTTRVGNAMPVSSSAVEAAGLTSLAGHISAPRSIAEWTLADLILVSSIDGSLRALDRQTGLEVWTIAGERPLSEVSTSETLLNKTRNPRTQDCDDCDLIWITEPLGEGTLYYFTPQKGLQQLPLSIKELVQAPYAFGKDQKLITGSHYTTLYSIEAGTGRILKVYGAEKSTLSTAACPVSKSPFYPEDDYDDYDEDDDLEQGSFMIGRTGKF